MLGSTHGTLTTTTGPERAAAPGGARPSAPVPAGPAELDVSGRPLQDAPPELGRLFRPSSVAVIGATETGRDGAALTRQMIDWAGRMGARLHPVHPSRASVYGVACAGSVAELPEPPDLAVLLVADPEPVLAELARCGTPFAVAPAGRVSEEAAERAARSGLRLLTPGVRPERLGSVPREPGSASVALITQAGYEAGPLLALREAGVPVAYWAPTGNEPGLEASQFMSWFASRPEVGAVAVCLEHLKDGRAFLLAADRAARAGKPVVAVQAGRDPAVDAAMRQFGVVRADGVEELRDTAALLARARPPQARGVAVYAPSGGSAAHLADLVAAAGLHPAGLAPATRETLRSLLPDGTDAANPVVCGAGAAQEPDDGRITRALLEDPGVGALICTAPGPAADGRLHAIAGAAQGTGKPLCLVGDSPAQVLREFPDLAAFRTVAGCARGVAAWLDHHDFVRAHRSPFEEMPRSPSPSARKARAVMEQGRHLSEYAGKQLLRAYGIRVPREQLVTSAAGAVRSAAQVGYPVALKASAPQLAHRAEYGLVSLGLTSASQVREAYRELTATARAEDIALDGVLVCQQVEQGVDMAVRVTRDERFGPVVTVGLGGILMEVLRDTAVRVPPFGTGEVHAMIQELHGRALLEGVRGRPPADTEALAEVVLRVQRMALELDGELAELVIDPLVVLPRGRGAVALDAVAVCR